jgi:putative lipoprotein
MLPQDAPAVTAGLMTVEVRDVSLQDIPSVVISKLKRRRVALSPAGEVPFVLEAEEVDPRNSLSLRVHISLDGSGRVQRGDLLTTSHHAVPAQGTPPPMAVDVQVI